MAGLMVVIGLTWLASFILGLPVTQAIATLMAIPYGGLTAYLAWQHVRAR
jgi:hypothetical protein